MNERTPKHPPLDGERLKQAIAEMNHPKFFKKLTGSIISHASCRGLYYDQMLPGGKTCDDLATDIIMLILKGRRKWEESEKTFLDGCMYVAKSVLSNWCNLVDNKFQQDNISYAAEDFSEDEDEGGVCLFPASNAETAVQITLRKEAQEKEQSQLLALSEIVETGTLEARIVQELFDDVGIEGRAQMVARLGCTGAEFDAAYKRLIRLVPKIKNEKGAIK